MLFYQTTTNGINLRVWKAAVWNKLNFHMLRYMLFDNTKKAMCNGKEVIPIIAMNNSIVESETSDISENY